MPKSDPSPDHNILIRGANQHNLKNLDLDIPQGQFTVITGPSGSGKSSLAFHTLYAEGQRRYVETFSPYVRQFMDRMDKPVVDRIENIPPAIAVEQKNNIRTTRSTVGTLTELNDYLKVIYPHLAKAFDPKTGQEIRPDTPASIAKALFVDYPEQQVMLTFSFTVPANFSTAEVCDFLSQQGYLRILIDGKVWRTDEPDHLAEQELSEVLVIQDRVVLKPANAKRLQEAIEHALSRGKGRLSCHFLSSETSRDFSILWENPDTGLQLSPPTAAHFSFNSPIGACPECRGFGRVIGIDPAKAIQDPTLSLKKGVVQPFQTAKGAESKRDLLRCAAERGISTTCPWYELSAEDQHWVLHGEGGDAEDLWHEGLWYGVTGFFQWMERKAYKMHVRVFLAKYRAYTRCHACDGTRLKPYASYFLLDGHSISDLWQLPLTQLNAMFEKLDTPTDNTSVKLALSEIRSRLDYLIQVGLGYLTLDRPARTLSGGEIERVNLTTCIGAALTNTLFVLDEPTVGLHARDIHRLIGIIHQLRDRGNTVVVVEHEQAVMQAADQLLDIGPKAGEMGGQLTFQGDVSSQKTLRAAAKAHESLTLDFLTGKRQIARPSKRREAKRFLKIKGAHRHNLVQLDCELPLGVMTCLTGLSGSGKSTLAHDVIYLNLLKAKHLASQEEPAFVKSLTGDQHLHAVHLVDQSPLTRTPRSTPAVHSGAFDAIRELFSLSPLAKRDELTAGYFSFNSGAGRCERCWGNGFEKVEMQFLSDLYITCPECLGSRYHQEAHQYLHDDKNIAETLQLTVTEALAHFTPTAEKSKVNRLKAKIQRCLQPLAEVGLGYLRLGQALNTLSGGESQRLKLCELLKNTSTEPSLLILDEPTTGLHFADIELLLGVFHQLVEAGHTLLIIEHNLDVIANADHLIDLGPGAGEDGGNIVFTGTPEALLATDPAALTETARALADHLNPAQGKCKKARKAAGESSSPAAHAIILRGARENNLKNIDVDIPRDELVCLTGLSGSGKSTLAFDILFAEGQRRFLDSMSPYARQFAGQMEKPDIDKVDGLPPTVAIEQRISRGGGKSTVGTVTEIYHFLRLLYAKLGTQHCPESGMPVVSQTSAAIQQQVTKVLKKHANAVFAAPIVLAKKGYHTDIVAAAQKLGYTELIVDGKHVLAEDFTPLARYKEHDIYVLCPAQSLQDIEDALDLGSGRCGTAILEHGKAASMTLYSTSRVSPVTGRSFPEPDPHHFSFNSPRGWCPECRGYGKVPDLSAVAPKKKRKKKAKGSEYNSKLEEEIHQELAHTRHADAPMMPCPECAGARLRRDSLHILLNGKNISEVTKLPVTQAAELLEAWTFAGREQLIARDILPEITQRLRFLERVGLDYLALDRSADTLSGGESQRIRLAAQLGSNLTGVLYILDEPTIGLHPRDNKQLLDTLVALKDRGNSLLVVEHDEETMSRADTLLHIGPGAGKRGGQIINDIPPLLDLPKAPRRPIARVADKDAWLKLTGCTKNNLKGINVRIPLGRLTVISGVSGCGKSSLMRGTLAEVARLKKSETSTVCQSASGFDKLKYTYEVDQTPIGKTSRSCPATYVKALDDIRKLMAQVPEAKMRGYTASRFSFNNAEGQCPECKGNGRIKLEMDFLPTTYVPCEACGEKRYNPATLEILYNGKNIGDILEMNIEEAAEFFQNHSKLARTMHLLNDTGLGYLQLGQPSPTLSGGEAQRIKLVAELTKGRVNIAKMANSNRNLYLIEEPSIGLHADDVVKLIEVLHRLVDEGHTVVIVEHHTAIMAQADYLIDMGPEAGDAGGTIVAQGKPETVAKSKKARTAPFLREALDALPK